MSELDPEDAKLVTLARGAMGRTGGATGAAVRDTDGRTYAAGEVSLHSLQLTALQAAIAAAISSGAQGFEAGVIVGAATTRDPGLLALTEVTTRVKQIFARTDGSDPVVMGWTDYTPEESDG